MVAIQIFFYLQVIQISTTSLMLGNIFFWKFDSRMKLITLILM